MNGHVLQAAAVIGGILVAGSVSGLVLRLGANSEARRRLAADVTARVNAWWWMAGISLGALLAGSLATTILFGLLSFLALREFITLTPTRRGDHHTLFWAFFIIVPLQYLLVGFGWYGLFIVLVPVWAFLFVAMRSAFSGDSTSYLERTAKVQWGLMLCVFCVSHIPMFFQLDIPGFTGRQAELVLWLITVVQLSDVLQYVWGKALGRRKVAPHLSPNKTWEGLIGGIASASCVGMALHWLTPFTPVEALGMAVIATSLGFIGGLVMSAIKRDAGVKDFGNLIPGHGGILDRIDSLTFAAPAVFHLVRYYWSA